MTVGSLGVGVYIAATMASLVSERTTRSSERAFDPWVSFVLQRLVSAVVVFVFLMVATFNLVRLVPGDPASTIAGPDAPESEVERVRHELGLDRPYLEQFVSFAIGVSRGDLGASLRTKQPVREIIAQRTGTSLQLAATALILVLAVSIPVGMMAGALTRQGRRKRFEVGFAAGTSVVGSLPEFLTATFLAFIFAVWLRLLPVAGTGGWQYLVLPALSIVLRPTAVLARIVRVETLNVLAQDYIRTARSKRLPERLIYLRHTLPNVATATLTIGGIMFAGVIGGAVVVENVFARAGLGTALVQGVLARDYPVVQGIILLLGVTVVVVNAMVDLLLGLIDPRSLARQG